jgi:hypothetical protein
MWTVTEISIPIDPSAYGPVVLRENLKVNVSECNHLGSIIELFDIHRDEPFIYSADTH